MDQQLYECTQAYYKVNFMMQWFVLVAFGIACVAVCILLPKISIISFRKGLVDMPQGRKIHTQPVSRLGGVSFFPTIVFSVSITLAVLYLLDGCMVGCFEKRVGVELLFIMCGLTLLYLVGIGDDLVGVRYKKKFIIQWIVALFIPLSGVSINHLYGLLGINILPSWAGIPFTLFLVVFVTNAMNLIDGIDGLASGLGSVALLVLGISFGWGGLWAYAILAFATLGVLVPFFYYNVFGRAENNTKIFMGDTGSLTLGYILSFLCIRHAMYDPAQVVRTFSPAALMVPFAILLVPMLDVVRVVWLRARLHISLFTPDRNHIHHKFLAMGLSHRQAMTSILLISCLFVFSNIMIQPFLNINVLFAGDILLWIFLNLLFDWARERRR